MQEHSASVNCQYHSFCQGISWKVFLHSVQPSTFRSSRNRTMVSRDYSKGGITGERHKRVIILIQIGGYFWRVICNKNLPKKSYHHLTEKELARCKNFLWYTPSKCVCNTAFSLSAICFTGKKKLERNN